MVPRELQDIHFLNTIHFCPILLSLTDGLHTQHEPNQLIIDIYYLHVSCLIESMKAVKHIVFHLLINLPMKIFGPL